MSAVLLGLVEEPNILKPYSLLAFGIQSASLIQTINGIAKLATGERKMKFNLVNSIWNGIGWLLRRIPNENNALVLSC